ncbi:Uncharacterised protein [Serratia marcescens]|nr:Uncharacterised protein [Serratia marcescens]CAI1776783.1 Uncharacterised protein [Serratia marcescens]
MDIKVDRLKKDLLIEWVKRFYSRLNVSQKLHLNYILLFIYTYVIFLVLSYGQIFRAALLLAIVFWCIALVYDAILLYKKVYENIIGKALLTIILVIGTNFSISIAGGIINDVSGVEPSNFPHVLIIISILTIPFITALIALFLYYILALIVFPFILFYFLLLDAKVNNFLFPFNSKKDDVFIKKSTVLIKVFSFGIFFIFIYGISQNTMSWYENKLSKFSENLIYTFEMYSKSPCDLDIDAKSLFINGDRIIFAKKVGDEVIFKVVGCNYKK